MGGAALASAASGDSMDESDGGFDAAAVVAEAAAARALTSAPAAGAGGRGRDEEAETQAEAREQAEAALRSPPMEALQVGGCMPRRACVG